MKPRASNKPPPGSRKRVTVPRKTRKRAPRPSPNPEPRNRVSGPNVRGPNGDRLFRTLVEHSSDAIALVGADGKILYESPSALSTLGYEADELVGHNALERIHPDDLPRAQQLFGQLLQQPDSTIQAELRNRCKDGSWIWLEAIGTNLISDPSVRAIVADFRDITERKNTEAALRQSRDQLEVILRGVAEAITVQEPSGKLVYANEAAARLIGYASVEELLHMPVSQVTSRFELMDEAGNPFPITGLPGRLALQGKQPPDQVLRFRVKAMGEERWSLVSASPVFDEHGQVQLAINIFRDITERHQTEEALREQRESLRVTVASIGDAVMATDRRGQITLINGVAQELSGWSETEAIAKPLAEVLTLLNEETGAPIEDPVTRVLREGVVVGLGNHTVLVRRDGERIPIEDSAAPIRDARGRTIGVVLVFRDASERRAAEAAIGRLAAIVESSEDAIIGTTLDGTMTTWNAAAERLYGYTAEEAVGQPAAMLVPPNYRDELPAVLERLKQGAAVEHYETERITKDGRRIPVEITFSAVKDKSGAIIGASKIGHDITRRKQVEADQRFLVEASELLSSSLDYETTLDRVAQLAVAHLAEWCSVDIVNAAGEVQQLALAHVDPEKVVWARELQRRYPPDPNSSTGVYQVLRTGQAELVGEIPEAALIAAARDEEQLKIIMELGLRSYMVVPLIARGRTLGAISFISGRSGRRYGPDDLALAQELARLAALAVDNARLYREAQHAVQVRDRFLTIASHELKTPLTSLIGYAELLSRWTTEREGWTARDLRAIKAIAEQTTRLNRMINALLDVSRLETGQMVLDRKPTDLFALTSQVIEDMRPILKQHSIQVTGDGSHAVVEADDLRLEQVLQNLVQNAVKYSPQGGRIEVNVRREGENACVSVRDEGIGIPASEQQRLFGRFYRASNAEAQHIAGLGVGLYIVREIVRLHGGQVTVESQEGKGSTFTVCLPANAEGESAAGMS